VRRAAPHPVMPQHGSNCAPAITNVTLGVINRMPPWAME
jgi:hypothetical protein